MLVIPSPEGFLLQLAKDLAPAVAKRLSMFVLRSKVKIADESDAWAQYGFWDADGAVPSVAWAGDTVSVGVGERRFLRDRQRDFAGRATATEDAGRCRRSAPGGRGSARRPRTSSCRRW